MTEVTDDLHICGNILSSKNYSYFALQCVICSASFGQWTSFLRHLQDDHKASEFEDFELKEFIEHKNLKQEEEIIEIDIGLQEEEKELHSVFLNTKVELEVTDDEPMLDCSLEIEEEPNSVLKEHQSKFTDDVFRENLIDAEELKIDSDKSESELNEFKFNLSDEKYRSVSLEFLKLLHKNRALWDTQHNDYRLPRKRSMATNQMKSFFRNKNIELSTESLVNLISSILQKYQMARKEKEADNEDISIESEFLLKKCSYLETVRNTTIDLSDFDAGNDDKETDSDYNIEDEPIKTKIKNRIKFSGSHPIVEEFIDLYKESKFLWDTTMQNYNNRIDRKKLFATWADKFKIKYDIEFTYDEIAYAAQEFRRIYFKALKRRDESDEVDKYTKFILEKGSFLPPRRQKPNIKCQHCVKVFQHDYTLKRHIYVDHGIGEIPFACSFCDLRFEDYLAQRRHELRYHYKDYQYNCEYCNKPFFTREERDRHLAAKHTGVKRFVCEQCGNPFSKKINLRNHVTRVHMRQRNFPCNLCPKAFYTKALLQDHLNAHFNIRDKICKTCGKGFTSYHSLMRHKQIHSEVKRYACKLCDARFHQLVGLNSHMKNTHKFVKNKNETASDEEINLIDFTV